MTRDSRDETGDASRIEVSVVIVTWNSAAWIGRCLDALPDACEGLEWEAIVRDNASDDSTVEIVEPRGGDRIVLLAGNENAGFAGGMNRALERARGRMVMLLNPDCEPVPGSIAKLAAALDASTGAAGVAPVLVGEDGVPQLDFQLRKLPTLGSLAADLLLLDELVPSNRVTANHRYADAGVGEAIEQPAAAALLLRRSVIDEIGPFDERFHPAWFDDVDYSRRMKAAGRETRLVPDATVTHRGGASLDHVEYAEFLRIWYRNLGRYTRKWFSVGANQMVRWLVIAGMILRIAATLVGLSRAPIGKLAVCRAYRDVMKEAFLRWGDGSRSS